MKKLKILLACLLSALLIINMTGCKIMNDIDSKMTGIETSEEKQEEASE